MIREKTQYEKNTILKTHYKKNNNSKNTILTIQYKNNTTLNTQH